jgi:predicted nuclease with TOPRIM domain
MASPKSIENDHRLDRIEAKIDKLAEAIISLARAEEKLMQLEEDKKFLMGKMIKLEERMEKTERVLDENSTTISAINRIFWIALSGTIVTLIGAYLMRRP